MEKCPTVAEQAKTFSVILTPVLRSALSDLARFNYISKSKEFREFTELLNDFLVKLVCDSHYLVQES